MNCLSFNTTVERTTMMGRDAAAFLDELDQQRNRAGGGRVENAAAAQRDYNAMAQQHEVEMQMQGINMMDDEDENSTGRNEDDDDDEMFMD